VAAGSNRTVWNPLSILSACPPLLRCGEDGFGFLVSRFQFLIPGLGYRTTSLGQCPDHVSALLCSSLCTAPRVCSSLRGLRAYARLCAATRVCSSLCAAQGELSSGALGPGCPSGTTRQWAAHVLVRQALSKMNRALLVTPLAGGGLPAAGLNRSCATRTPTMHSYLYGLCVRMFACNCMPLSLSLSPSLAFYFDHLYHHIPRLWFCFCVILLGMMLSARPLLSMCYRLPLPNVAYKCILKCIRCLQ